MLYIFSVYGSSPSSSFWSMYSNVTMTPCYLGTILKCFPSKPSLPSSSSPPSRFSPFLARQHIFLFFGPRSIIIGIWDTPLLLPSFAPSTKSRLPMYMHAVYTMEVTYSSNKCAIDARTSRQSILLPPLLCPPTKHLSTKPTSQHHIHIHIHIYANSISPSLLISFPSNTKPVSSPLYQKLTKIQ